MKILSFALSLLFIFSCASSKPAPPKEPLRPLACRNFKCQLSHHAQILQRNARKNDGAPIAFIVQHAETVRQVAKSYDLPPEILLAAAMLESAHGQSELAKCAFNFHGIKCGDGWDGSRYVTRGKKPAQYRAYSDAHAGFVGCADYICQRVPRFVGANVLPCEFAHAWGSNNPELYTQNLHSIITRYGLKTLFAA